MPTLKCPKPVQTWQSKTEEELITADAKSFDMGGKTVRVDQVNTVDLDEVFAREAAFTCSHRKNNQPLKVTIYSY